MSKTNTVGGSAGNLKHPKKIGAYEIINVIAASNRSTIYRAADESGEPVWLMALPQYCDHEYVLNFKRRLETLIHLNHPALPEIVDNRTRKGSHAFATISFRPLTSLFERFEMKNEDPKPLPAVEALGIVHQIAEVLAILHPAGLVHNDLHPKRIFFDGDDQLLIIDAALPFIPFQDDHDKGNITHLPYASPEEREGKSITARGNIYSLGVILYHLLAGHQPRLPISEWDIFEYKALPREIPLEQEIPGLTPETYELVRNCLWQKEWSRYETMEQLLAAIDIATKAEEIGPQKPKFFSRYRNYLLVGVPIFVLLVAFIIFMIVRG